MKPKVALSIILLAINSLGQNLPSGTPDQPDRKEIKIIVLEGEAAKHSIVSRIGVQTMVEIRDDTGKPVPGAQVLFQLPASGSGGSFPGGRLSQRVISNAQGRASTSGFAPNDLEGRFNVKVTCSSGTLTASAIVAQVNIKQYEVAKKSSSKLLWILLAAGGAGAVGVVAATKGGGGSTSAPTGPVAPPPSITIFPGPVTVGGPK